MNTLNTTAGASVNSLPVTCTASLSTFMKSQRAAMIRLMQAQGVELLAAVSDLMAPSSMATAIASLEEKWGYEHAYYTREDWRNDVGAANTLLGYWEWVQHNFESHDGAQGHCACGSPVEQASGATAPISCGTCSEPVAAVDGEVDDVLSSYTYYSFHIGSMSNDDLLAEADLREIPDDEDTSSGGLRSQLLEWYATSARAKADEAFENYDFSTDEFDGIVADCSGWTTCGYNEFSRSVYLIRQGNLDEPSVLRSFSCEATPLGVSAVSVSG